MVVLISLVVVLRSNIKRVIPKGLTAEINLNKIKTKKYLVGLKKII